MNKFETIDLSDFKENYDEARKTLDADLAFIARSILYSPITIPKLFYRACVYVYHLIACIFVLGVLAVLYLFGEL